jgi:hypothetical protein
MDDGIAHIAHIFKQDCAKRLRILEEVQFVFESSDTIDLALRLLFIHSTMYPDEYSQITAIPAEINKLRACIETMEVRCALVEENDYSLTF